MTITVLIAAIVLSVPIHALIAYRISSRNRIDQEFIDRTLETNENMGREYTELFFKHEDLKREHSGILDRYVSLFNNLRQLEQSERVELLGPPNR